MNSLPQRRAPLRRPQPRRALVRLQVRLSQRRLPLPRKPRLLPIRRPALTGMPSQRQPRFPAVGRRFPIVLPLGPVPSPPTVRSQRTALSRRTMPSQRTAQSRLARLNPRARLSRAAVPSRNRVQVTRSHDGRRRSRHELGVTRRAARVIRVTPEILGTGTMGPAAMVVRRRLGMTSNGELR